MLEDIGSEFSLDGTDRRRTARQIRNNDESQRAERTALRTQSIRNLNAAVEQQSSTLERLSESSRVTDFLALSNAQLAIATTFGRWKQVLALEDWSQEARDSFEQALADIHDQAIFARAWFRRMMEDASQEDKSPEKEVEESE